MRSCYSIEPGAGRYRQRWRSGTKLPGSAIKNQSEAVWRLLQQEAAVFVCGEASRMAPDVRQAVAAVFRDHTGISAANAPCLANGPGSEPALSGGHLGLRCLTRTGLVLQPIGSAIALPAGEMGCMLPGSEAPA